MPQCATLHSPVLQYQCSSMHHGMQACHFPTMCGERVHWTHLSISTCTLQEWTALQEIALSSARGGSVATTGRYGVAQSTLALSQQHTATSRREILTMSRQRRCR